MMYATITVKLEEHKEKAMAKYLWKIAPDQSKELREWRRYNFR
jgi:hypothetical protein